jgi:hypothetical protein
MTGIFVASPMRACSFILGRRVDGNCFAAIVMDLEC